MKRKRKGGVLRMLRRLLILAVLGFVIVVGYANLTAILASRGRLFTTVENLPLAKTGLVFGTSDRLNSGENPYFRYRIDAAVQVWESGKLDTLIVSGDNRSRYYNEPERMKAALVSRGVPADRIICDYAGLRTLDSVVRAKEVFGAKTVLFISQRFQNERAIYIAKANGVDAYGFNARDVQTHWAWRTRLREVGARVKMWLDVNFLDTRPRHGGEAPGNQR